MPPQPTYNPDRRAAFLERYGIKPKGAVQEAFADLPHSYASVPEPPKPITKPIPVPVVSVISPFPKPTSRGLVVNGFDKPQYGRKQYIKMMISSGRGYCFYCGRKVRQHDRGEDVMRPDSATADHCIPIVYGGTNHESNYVLSCGPCNNMKGWMTDKEFRWFIAECPWLKTKTTAEYLQEINAFPTPERYELDRPKRAFVHR